MAAEMIRVNTRISKTLNDWLDKRSEETGMPKSTLVMLALENYYQQVEVMKNMSDLGSVMAKIDELQEMVKEGKQ